MHIDRLVRTLWPHGNSHTSSQVYALLDGARDERIARAVWRSDLPYTCLFAGTLSPALQLAAPYVVQLAPESRFFKWLVESGWGHAWGLYAAANPDVTLPVLRKHFRSLLRVKDEHGKLLAFRFYDPRVLRVYMPTCLPVELDQVFGPMHTLACESDDGESLIEYRSERNEPERPQRSAAYGR